MTSSMTLTSCCASRLNHCGNNGVVTNDRLRRENRILKEERNIVKKATQFFASQKP